MNVTKHTLAVLFLLVVLGSSTQAQTDDNLNMDVTVDGIRENVIREAGKISSWPQFRENIVELPPITYNLVPNKLGVSIEPKLIDPVKVKIEEPLKKLYRGYARAGFGVYTTPLVELHYMDGRSRNGTFAVSARHLSSGGGNVAFADSIPDGYADNEIRLWGKKFLGKHSLEAGFDWNRNMMHYYGFRPDVYDSVSIEDALHQQVYNNIDGYMRLTSHFRDSSKVNYESQLKFYNFRDAFSANENNVDFQIHGRGYHNHEMIQADVVINYNQLQNKDPLDLTESLKNQESVVIGITPMFSTVHEKWRVGVGFGMFLDPRSETAFHFYPKVEAKYNLISNIFIPYVGLGGQLERTTYKSIAGFNPWIVTNPELNNTSNKLDIYGGVRGTISSNTSFNLRVSRKTFENHIYFANDTLQSAGNQFVPIYDDLAYLQLMGEVAVNTNGALDLTLRGDYYIYGGTGQQLHPWDEPNTRFTLLASYNLEDKIVATAEVYTVGKRKAKSFATVPDARLEDDGSYTVDLRGFADVNLNIEWRYTKRLSLFLRLNNMMGGRYQARNQYSVQRFNAMMGLTYSF